MSSQALLAMVTELKTLNAKRKSGAELSPAEQQRRRELKAVLAKALEQQKQGAPGGGRPEPTSVSASALHSSALGSSMASQSSPAIPAPAPVSWGESPLAHSQPPIAITTAPAAAGPTIGGAIAASSMFGAPPTAAPPPAVAERTDPGGISTGGYTPAELNLGLNDYYGEYFEEGFDVVSQEGDVQLGTIDPREEILQRALAHQSDAALPVPAGLAFLDDFPELYTSGVLLPPGEDAEPDVEDPNAIIPGKRKVTVHMLAGAVKRGFVRSLKASDAGFTLDPDGTGSPEKIPLEQIKALFVHLGKGKSVQSQGQKLTVTFRDRRSVQGTSVDYRPDAAFFTLVPPANAAGQFEKILINRKAVAKVS